MIACILILHLKKIVNLNYKDARYEEILKKLNLNKIKKSKNFYKIKLQEKGKKPECRPKTKDISC